MDNAGVAEAMIGEWLTFAFYVVVLAAIFYVYVMADDQ
jgi:hypothetical protein